MITPAEVTADTKLNQIFETQTCSRCGGSGRYSWNQRDRDRCYGCGGSGRKYTKRGQAARNYWEYLTTATVDTFSVGDRIFDQMYGWLTITEIIVKDGEGKSGSWGGRKPEEFPEGYRFEEREEGRPMMYWYGKEYNVRTNKVNIHGLHPDDKRQVSTPALNLAIKKGIATYQSQLTKQGKLRKR